MKSCRKVRRRLRSEAGLGPGEEQHFFACPACRKRARSERAEREIESLASRGAPPTASVPPDFVSRVMRGLPRASAGRSRPPVSRWKWAAAVAIFSVAAGYGYTVGTDTSAAGQQVAAVSPSPGDEIAFFAF